MKTALFITSGFPPEESGGTIRIAKLAKYLPLFGWQLTVVTAKPPIKDMKLSVSLSHYVKVYRAPRVDITGSCKGLIGLMRRIILFIKHSRKSVDINCRLTNSPTTTCGTLVNPRRRLAEYFFVPDDRIGWVPIAFILGAWSVFRDRPSVIYATSPSATTLLVGCMLNRVTGLPWIVEFRDPWMLNPFRISRPFKWMESLEAWLEKAVLGTATRIVVTSPQYKHDIIRCYPQLNHDSIICIPNGFDPEDFEEVTPRAFEKFTVVHTGNFYAARSSIQFLRALSMAIERCPAMRGHLQVFFAGQHDLATQVAATELGLTEIVTQIGVMSHRQCIESIMGANILLLVPGPGNGTMPGKTFEYLAGMKPILALADEGPVREIITSTGAGEVFSPSDSLGISDFLVRQFQCDSMHRGVSCLEKDAPEILKQYDRKEIALRIATLMETLV